MRNGKLKFKDTGGHHYQRVATELEYPDVTAGMASQDCTAPPLVLSLEHEPEYWELRIEEAVQLALANSRVLRDLGGLVLHRRRLRLRFMARRLSRPIRDSASKRHFTSSMRCVWHGVGGKNDRPLNNAGGPSTPENFLQDVTVVEGEIQKRSATGSLFALRHILDYDANTTPSNRFPTIWNTHVEGEFRQPLLQGAGVNYNRIAGLNGVPGQANGVLVARINSDISLADFEMGVRDLVSNVENAYWDLYFAYRDLDARIAAQCGAG